MGNDKSSSKFLEQAKHFKDEQKSLLRKNIIFHHKNLNLRQQRKITKYFMFQKLISQPNLRKTVIFYQL